MKKIEDYKTEEAIQTRAEKEREISDRLYASKLVERIVIGALVAAGLGSLTFLGKLIIDVIQKIH